MRVYWLYTHRFAQPPRRVIGTFRAKVEIVTNLKIVHTVVNYAIGFGIKALKTKLRVAYSPDELFLLRNRAGVYDISTS